MKRFLIPLIAALTLPTTVNAESYWLILTYGEAAKPNHTAALEKIEMASLEACKKEGRKWEESPTQGVHSRWRRFHCVIGK